MAKYLLVVSALIVCFQGGFSSPQERILDGNVVDTLRRFPHHVTITSHLNGTRQDCSGSIIADKWILTSMNCVRQEKFTVHFRMQTMTASKDSFALTLDESSVTAYPTGYDNIALVKLPVLLQFSEDLNVIPYSRKFADNGYSNGFVVMPGFSPLTKGLAYGMFQLISPTECKTRYGKAYDEYLQICTLGWGNNNQVPCEGNEGGGLVIEWPRKPRLIGIFTSPLKCVSNMPAIYVNLAQYEKWIEDVITQEFRSYPYHHYWAA